LWEPFHVGAARAAHKNGWHIYWNAPTQVNDVEGQIRFLNLALERHYRGVVIAPDESLVFRTPIRRLLERHIPVVVVDDDLKLPPNPDLSYVLNDEVIGGQTAARRVNAVLHGKGAIAVLGINPQLESIVTRDQSFEQALAHEAPRIHIAVRKFGDDSSVLHQQQIAESVLHSDPQVDAIVALSASATRGAYYAKINYGENSKVILIGFDQDLIPPIRSGEIDSIIIQNTPEIGRVAIDDIVACENGKKVPPRVLVAPALLTRENLDAVWTKQMWHYARFPWSEQ